MVHGWGLGPGFWRLARNALPSSNILTVDMGFFGPSAIRDSGRYAGTGIGQAAAQEDAAQEKAAQKNAKNPPVVGIGHSLGFMWLLKNLEKYNFKGLVSVNGFTRFAAADYYPGVADRIIARMILQFRRSPQKVLEDFRKRAAMPSGRIPSSEKINSATLEEALLQLQKWDCREILTKTRLPVLALAARDDAIVPPEMTEACFGQLTDKKIEWSETGGHALPINKPAWTAEQIKLFIDRLMAS